MHNSDSEDDCMLSQCVLLPEGKKVTLQSHSISNNIQEKAELTSFMTANSYNYFTY